ncbi:MAG: inositol 2-dehydrogenase [Pseudomonadota bacterium]
MINIGLLGCGRIGQVHARSFLGMKTARIAAVADALPEAAAALASEVGCPVASSDAILTDSAINAVVIGTPTTTHYDLIHGAAREGKAIFCEKPVDLSTERTRECLAAVAASNVAMMVAFNRRFDPNFAALKARIEAGDVGDVELVTVLSRDPAPPPIGYIKTSGGLFRDMMIHDFDMARHLLGEDPVEVVARGSCLVDPAIGEAGDVDTAAVTLRTASGKIAQISNSRRASYGYDQRIEVHGSRAMVRADNQLESTLEIANGDGFRRAPTQHFFLERYAAAFGAEMAHFVECLTNGTPMTPDGTDGLKAQILADAADASARNGTLEIVDLTAS